MQKKENSQNITVEQVQKYADSLREQEKSAATIMKYQHDLTSFYAYLSGKELSKNALIGWKEHLTQQYAPASVNSMLAAVNGYLDWLGKPECKVKPIKIQRNLFIKPERELTRAEYLRLVQAADNEGNRRLALLLQTICGTGIRVSELKFITAEALRTGRAIVDCKGKTRTVFMPKELCKSLMRYCREQGITGGIIFRTKGGKPLDRSNIWRDMRSLCKSAGVEPGKVFPHNLRHLFARTYYSLEKDLSRLADLLGHSNVNTTKIYTMESGKEHAKQLDRMGLILAKS